MQTLHRLYLNSLIGYQPIGPNNLTATILRLGVNTSYDKKLLIYIPLSVHRLCHDQYSKVHLGIKLLLLMEHHKNRQYTEGNFVSIPTNQLKVFSADVVMQESCFRQSRHQKQPLHLLTSMQNHISIILQLQLSRRLLVLYQTRSYKMDKYIKTENNTKC